MPNVNAVLFVRDLTKVAKFYAQALGMSCTASDEFHWRLDCRGFELIVHQIPAESARAIAISDPPERRVRGALRLDYPVADLARSRQLAASLGGGIDAAPPGWAGADANFFLGYDPEGNQFGVSQG